MALLFGAVTSDRVRLGTGLDNISEFTMLFWFYRTVGVDADNRCVLCKGSNLQKRFYTSLAAGSDDMALDVKRATTNAMARSGTGGNGFATGVWHYVAATYDGTDGPRVFKGSLTATAAEITYDTRTVGSGSESDDSGEPWTIGNTSNSAGFGSAFQGRIAFVGLYDRRFSLTEVRAYQFRPVPDEDCSIFMRMGWNGTGTQPNWGPTGSANNGTVTGATVGDHMPITPTAWIDLPAVMAGQAAAPPAYFPPFRQPVTTLRSM